MNPPQEPPQPRIWQLGLGFATTTVLSALVKAGVIEQLGEQPKKLTELVQACGLNADVLSRTLRFAAVIDVVTLDGEQYALTDVGRLLLKDVPGSLYMFLLLMGSEPWRNAWNNFSHTLATGDNAFEPVMGVGFFEYLDQHPEYGAPLNQWMTIPFGTICDIGGGQGILLHTILIANPHLRGILYDQENVVKGHVLADMAARVEIQPGNFFERVPGSDVLLLKHVLHDWSDEKCQVILSHCREAMQPSSRLLIVEMVIPSPPDLTGAFYDLHMQVLNDGRERTENEFRLLLQKEGLKLNRMISTKSPMKIIEASL
jgi:hypothetical protein